MPTIIEFRHIRKAYGEKVVLPDLNLTIEQGSLSP